MFQQVADFAIEKAAQLIDRSDVDPGGGLLE
jgi:hypothetical protein